MLVVVVFGLLSALRCVGGDGDGGGWKRKNLKEDQEILSNRGRLVHASQEMAVCLAPSDWAGMSTGERAGKRCSTAKYTSCEGACLCGEGKGRTTFMLSAVLDQGHPGRCLSFVGARSARGRDAENVDVVRRQHRK